MKKALIVVDMQNDFIDGSLGSKEAKGIIERVAEKIVRRRKEGYDIIVTLDTHGENYLSTREGRVLPIKHCVKGTSGWRLNSQIAELTQGCKVYEKNGFASQELILDMKSENPDIIELVGLCTDICVVSNALGIKAFLPECEITVDSSCCAGVSPERHDAALETMKSCQINVI